MNPPWTPQNFEIQAFSEWLDRDESFSTPYSEKTKRVYCSVVTGLLACMSREGIRSFEEFNTAWVRRFVARNPESGAPYSLSYQTLRASALNIFWFWLLATESVICNPVEQLLGEKRIADRRPAGGMRAKRLPDVLGWEEQRRLLRAVQQSECRTSGRDFALIALALASGVRCEEICTLLLPNVDLEYSRLRVIGKGNKERLIDFSHDSTAVGALETWLVERDLVLRARGEATDRLFVSINGKPMTESLVYQQVAKYLSLAGLTSRARHKGSHLLRHTATSIMFARQVPILQIKENLGHGQLVTTQIYAHLLPSETPRQAAAV